jgi:hypothetical protein
MDARRAEVAVAVPTFCDTPPRRLRNPLASSKLAGDMATIDIPDPRRSSYGQDYWLHRCQGFRVESPDGDVGTVKGLRFRDSIEPELLEVRTGLFGRRVLLIPVERVEQIFSNERRIILSGSSRFADPDVADRPQSERVSRRSERR